MLPNFANVGYTSVSNAMGDNFQNVPVGGVVGFPSVGIEASNYLNTQSYNTTSYGTPSLLLTSASSSIIEGMVPYMNNLSFVGDMTRAYSVVSTERYVSSDLGQLVVAFTPVASPTGEAVSNIHIVPYIGLSDESRVGFNVLSMPVTLPNYTITLDTIGLISPYNNTSPGTLATTLSNYGGAIAAYFSNGN